MKKIGLLGGMSWESSLNYYKIINEEVKRQLGGLHSARVVLNSIDFEKIEQLQHQGRWNDTAEILAQEAKSIESAGADFLLICTNTMHKVALKIEENISIPIIHIADATAQSLVQDGVEKVGLLGTAFTMEEDFYKGRLKDRFGLDVVIPNKNDIKTVHDIIYNELCLGITKKSSKESYLKIIEDLVSQGATAVILGCTEIAMLVNQNDTDTRLYDTTTIHALKAVEEALKDFIK